jgi:hypothetical protein
MEYEGYRRKMGDLLVWPDRSNPDSYSSSLYAKP